MADIDKVSSLDIETDDNVDMLIIFKDGLRVTMHLDLYGRPHEKYIRFIGEEGTIYWTADPNRIAVGKEMAEIWDSREFNCERNDMFLSADREFLDVLDGKPVKTCTIQDGVRVLSFIESARKSHSESRMVDFSS